MKRKIKEIKRIARGRLQGQYSGAIQAMIFCSLIVSFLEIPFSILKNEITFSRQNIIYYIAVILINIASIVLIAGQYRILLTLSRTGEMHLSELFTPVKEHSDRFIFTNFLLFGIYLLGMSPIFGSIALVYFYNDIIFYVIALLLSIIGIILLTYIILNFDLVVLAMSDHNDLSMMQAMNYTKDMMKGHKRRYLYLLLSFTGMQLLNLISFGVTNFWVQPYMMETITIFYLDINGELEDVTPEPMYINQYI